jgi:hypothetical protein
VTTVADIEDARWFQSHPTRRYRARPLMKSELAEVVFPYEFAHDAFAYTIVERGKFLVRYYLAMPALRQIDDNDDVVGEIFRQVQRTVIERYARRVIAREIAEEKSA